MNQTGDQAESQKRSCAAVASQLHSQTHFEDYLKKRSQDCDAFGDWRWSYRYEFYIEEGQKEETNHALEMEAQHTGVKNN